MMKVLTVAFALIALRRALIRYRKGYSLTLEFVLWALIWSGIGVVVFVPAKTDALARWLGVSSGFNALVFITVTGLLFAVYWLFVRTQTLEREITRLVRAQALRLAEPVPPSPPPPVEGGSQ
jgi:hypothetical protein